MMTIWTGFMSKRQGSYAGGLLSAVPLIEGSAGIVGIS
jgi:hypothetical protein